MSFTGNVAKPRRRSGFNLTAKRLTSMKLGYVYPVALKWLNPGDVITGRNYAFIRTQPLKAPLFGRVFTEVFTYLYPLRLGWDSFETFITGGADGQQAPEVPYRNADTPAIGSLLDHIGVPPTCDHKFNMIPVRCYNDIMNKDFLDPDFSTQLVNLKTSGADNTSNIELQKACWKKDYLTSARLYPQKGPDVLLPLGDTAPLVGEGIATTYEDLGGGNSKSMVAVNVGGADEAIGNNTPGTLDRDLQIPVDMSDVDVDLSAATSVTIRQLRLASAIQRYRENMSIAGSRYYERLAQLGVRSSDARLQLPELISRSSSVLQISEVLGTNQEATTNPLGSMAGHGIGGNKGRGFRRLVTEHCILMTVMVTRPETIYADGLERHMMYEVKEDFWQPELEGVGQQEIWNSEVFAAGNSSVWKGTWGYQDRYDEDRRQEASVHGDFRDTLGYWHLARMFDSLPALNDDFIRCTPDVDRVFPAYTEDVLYVTFVQKLKARRLLSGVARRQLL